MIDRYTLGAAGPVHNVQQLKTIVALWKQQTTPRVPRKQRH